MGTAKDPESLTGKMGKKGGRPRQKQTTWPHGTIPKSELEDPRAANGKKRRRTLRKKQVVGQKKQSPASRPKDQTEKGGCGKARKKSRLVAKTGGTVEDNSRQSEKLRSIIGIKGPTVHNRSRATVRVESPVGADGKKKAPGDRLAIKHRQADFTGFRVDVPYLSIEKTTVCGIIPRFPTKRK